LAYASGGTCNLEAKASAAASKRTIGFASYSIGKTLCMTLFVSEMCKKARLEMKRINIMSSYTYRFLLKGGIVPLLARVLAYASGGTCNLEAKGRAAVSKRTIGFASCPVGKTL
jgi:hypothetical protein